MSTLLLTAVACREPDAATAPVTTAGRTPTTTTSSGSPSVAPDTSATLPPETGRTRLDGFKEVTVTVTDADGTQRQHCLLLADTPPLRQRGLMFVEDRTLGGYDGMLFKFEEDNSGGFWMKNTRLPLSIAYIDADGRTVSMTDMSPCPDTATSCPSYPAGGDYRYAVEVPQGGLPGLGVSDRSKLDIGVASCASAASS